MMNVFMNILWISAVAFTVTLRSCTDQPLTGDPKPSTKETAMQSDKKTDKMPKTESEWKQELTDEQYYVLRKKGTERPFTGKYDTFFEEGTYHCAGCGNVIFSSDAKYDSGCGWPAFSAPADEDAVAERRDISHGMVRTEIYCPHCGGHLGHVFNDGPAPTGQRYCINSAALEFEEKQSRDSDGAGANHD
jgi:peptide-methionine (R)-S-oxide reductase